MWYWNRIVKQLTDRHWPEQIDWKHYRRRKIVAGSENLNGIPSPAGRSNSYDLSEFLEDTRIDRSSTQHATRKCSSNSRAHDILARQE